MRDKRLNLIIYTQLFTLFLLISTSCTPDFSINQNIIEYDNIKFVVLSPSLIAIQTEKCPSSKIDYKDKGIEFKVNKLNQKLVIETSACKIIYETGSENIFDGVQFEFNQGENKVISGVNKEDKQNLGGTIRSIDRCDGRLEYSEYNLESNAKPKNIPNGLLSARGWTVLKNVENHLKHLEDKGDSDEYFLFCYGNNYKQALKDFVNLNGKIPLLPKWSFGNWFSRYQPLTDKDYKDIVARFRQEKIPIDVIVPDMNWHKDGWFGLRFDEKNFPDMPDFLKWAKDNGIRVGFNHHPGAVHIDDSRSKDFVTKKLGLDYDSLKNATVDIFNNQGWGNVKNTLFYSEANSAHIEPFFNEFLAPIMDMGLDFNWVDGGPSIDNLNEYYRLAENHTNKRAIVLTRQVDGSFETHKYPIGFSADTYISWASLQFNTELTVMGANTGVYWSHDIGGHMTKNSDFDHKELFTRWVQSGALSPFCRLHATGGTEVDSRTEHFRQPWKWGNDVLDVARKFIQLKYELMPFTYTLNRKAHDEGLIICHGMYIDYPEYTKAYEYANKQYMYGPYLLVSPIGEPSPDGKGMDGMSYKNVWIPEGVWYDYFTGESVRGPIETIVSKPIDEMPLYIKEGAIIPKAPYMEHTNQKPLDTLIVEFYQPTKNMETKFSLYEDDNETLKYKEGQYCWTNITYTYDEQNETNIHIIPKGDYNRDIDTRVYRLFIKHASSSPTAIKINNEELPSNNWEFKDNTISCTTKKVNVSTELSITIN